MEGEQKMNKKYLWYGFIYLTVGILFSVMSIMNEGKISSLYSGIAGGGIVGGMALLGKYFYWNNPKRTQKYKEKLEDEEINLKDERNEMYRDKAGRYAYKIGMIIIGISIILFSILNAFDIYNSSIIMTYLGILWIVLYVIGIVHYRKLKEEH